MGWESFDVVRFDLWLLPQCQMRIAKLTSAYNLLIFGPRVLGYKTNLQVIIGPGSLLRWSDLTLGPSFKVK